MTQISATIVADSIATETNDRITTFLLTYPRFIHAELMTHRAFSRNAASSRAIPIQRMIDAVREAPASPVVWGANAKGMQAKDELKGPDRNNAIRWWQIASRDACVNAECLAAVGVHKQIANRVLEPFSWMTTLVTATEYHNFFALRCHADAQPEFQRLADAMLAAYVMHQPRPARPGEWHLPFDDADADETLGQRTMRCVARCARTSYTKHNGAFSLDEDVGLFHRLQTAGHWSPFEHVAYAVAGRHANFTGWQQLRGVIEPPRLVDLAVLAKARGLLPVPEATTHA